MEFVVYILFSEKTDKIYIGFTANLIARFFAHNHSAGHGWTARFRPWKVICCEFYNDKKTALAREKALKGAKARAFIRQKIIEQYFSVGFISA